MNNDADATTRLNPDLYRELICSLPVADVLRCSSTCTALKQLCEAELLRAVKFADPDATGNNLQWLIKTRLRGECVRLDVSGCAELTKAQVASVLAASPKLADLVAVAVGPGSWSATHLAKLLGSMPLSLRSAKVDVRLELKNDLHDGSPMLLALANPIVKLERLTLITDNVAPSQTASAAAAMAVSAAAEAFAAATLVDGEVEPEPEPEPEAVASELGMGLRRLSSVLCAQAASLRVLDATSGALGVERGGAALVLCPLLSVDGCALRELSASGLPRGTLRTIAPALAANGSVQTVRLNSCMLSGTEVGVYLARALDGHPSLTHLELEHNPILDTGGATLAAVLVRTRVRSLSLRFTGVADATCEVLGTALGGGAGGGRRPALRELQLSGNRISTAGVEALTRCGLGGLHSLDLTANLALDAGAALAIAKVLPMSELRTLRLAACKVDKRGCSRLAAELVRPGCKLALLDLSANHFGSDGSDELAWVLPKCHALTSLSLADCDLADEAADELLEALGGAPLRTLDLRWNRLSPNQHGGGRGVSADARVQAGSQKQQARQACGGVGAGPSGAASSPAGEAKKKAYVPKWAREQQKATSGSKGSAVG